MISTSIGGRFSAHELTLKKHLKLCSIFNKNMDPKMHETSTKCSMIVAFDQKTKKQKRCRRVSVKIGKEPKYDRNTGKNKTETSKVGAISKAQKAQSFQNCKRETQISKKLKRDPFETKKIFEKKTEKENFEIQFAAKYQKT